MSNEPALDIDADEEVVAAPPVRRAATRTRPRQTAPRDSNRESPRGGVEAVGRDGEPLSRKRKGGIDPFQIPPEIIPEGWTYQWNVVSVTGNADVCLDQGLGMYENGWRPVPAERHPGLFIARGKHGEIIRGGQRLEERPLALTEDARREEVRDARRLIMDRNDSLKLSAVKNGLADGLAMGKRYRGTGGDVRMSIDPGVYADESGDIREIPRPSHQLADRGDD